MAGTLLAAALETSTGKVKMGSEPIDLVGRGVDENQHKGEDQHCCADCCLEEIEKCLDMAREQHHGDDAPALEVTYVRKHWILSADLRAILAETDNG